MSEKHPISYNRRRAAVAAALGLALLASKEVVDIGVSAVDGLVTVHRTQVHKLAESQRFSKLNLADNLEKNQISPTSVRLYSVQPYETTPIQVATNHHAKDPMLVAREIAVQVGGDRSMKSGDLFVLPPDQINNSPPSVNSSH